MYLYTTGDDPADEELNKKLRLDKDVKAISEAQIIEISKVARRTHQIVTRIRKAVAEPMILQSAQAAAAAGCRTQPYFWARWDDAFWTDVSFAVENGSISESLTDETSRSLRLTAHSDHWTTFQSFQTEVSPFRTLLRVERGIKAATWESKLLPDQLHQDPEIRWVPLGIYRVHKVNFNRDHSADIEAYSMEQVLKDFLYETPPAPLAVPRSWIGLMEEKFMPGGIDKAGGQDWSSVTWEIHNSITAAAANLVSKETYPVGYLVGNGFNRWQGIKEMLEAAHFNLYVNRVGKPIVVRIPQPQDKMTWIAPEIQEQLIVNEGGDGNIISRSEDFNRDGLFNMIIAYGQIAVDNDVVTGQPQTEAAPVVKITTDDEPASMTYIGGPFGRIAKELQVENLLNPGKLEVAGKAELAKSKILTTRSNLSLLPNPTIEVGDKIKVHYPDGSYRWFVIETADIPLTSDAELSVQAFTYDNARTNGLLHTPTNIRIIGSPTDSSVTLRFTAATGAVGYEWSADAVMYWNRITTVPLPNNEVEMVITGLRPLTNYKILIRAIFEDEFVPPPVQHGDDFNIIRTPGTMLVAEGGWPGRFQFNDTAPANIVVANLFQSFHILPAPARAGYLNDPWPSDVYILMADSMEATWDGEKFVQWRE